MLIKIKCLNCGAETYTNPDMDLDRSKTVHKLECVQCGEGIILTNKTIAERVKQRIKTESIRERERQTRGLMRFNPMRCEMNTAEINSFNNR